MQSQINSLDLKNEFCIEKWGTLYTTLLNATENVLGIKDEIWEKISHRKKN